ncbi:MAG: hypothetical protein QM820_53890 [Minicystis sp.]
MTAPADSKITVRAGVAEPAMMDLPPGQAIGPLSVGRAGTWRVVAPGVLEEHAFLYFNGTELFLQSANPNSPVTVNGAAIPGDWTAVYAPCEIVLGGARLWFGPPKPVAKSRPPAAPSKPPPPVPVETPSAAGRRPFAPRVQGLDNDDDATRVHPIEDIQAVRRSAKDATGATLKSGTSPPSYAPPAGGAPPLSVGAPPPVPSFGAPPVGAPTFGAPTFGAPPPSAAAPVMGPGPVFGAPPGDPAAFPGGPAVPNAAPSMAPPGMVPPGAAPPVPAKRVPWIVARWREASGPKKALMALLVPLIWAVWVIFTDKPPPPRPPKPATSASAAPSGKPSAAPSAVPEASGTPTSAPQPPAPPPPAPSPSGKASAGPSSTPAPASTTKTREREAADAVAVGSYDKAARLYEELAKAHPDVPAYAEAARIMKAKAGKR